MTLKYLLDTNICIYIAKQKPINVLRKFEQLEIGSVGMSVVSYGELYFGAQKSKHPKKNNRNVRCINQFNSTTPLTFKCCGALWNDQK